MRMVECSTASAIRAVSAAFDSEQFEREHADVHLVAVDDHEGPKAQCSLWWSQVPTLCHQRLGTVGHYQSESDGAAQILLTAACSRLRSSGCRLAVGPMDGNPWRRYRFISDPGTEPAFFLEPRNPPAWPQQFVNFGFAPLASYVSNLNADLTRQDQRLREAAERLRSVGVVLRTLRPGELEGYLPRIYRVCCVAFKNSFLYAELSENDFLCLYKKLLPLLRSELFMVAEQGSETIGFLFAIADLLCMARGVPVDTFVIKTIAILPRRELAGLGAVMAGEIQQLGYEMGFRRCIHALMQAGNMVVRNISRLYAVPMRTYTLYAKDLRG